LNIRVHEAEKLSSDATSRFVEASEKIRFRSEGCQQAYGWAGQVLVQQQYVQHGKVARDLVRRCIEKMSRLIRALVTRWSHATQLPTGSV
jgi:hypothetical protein